MTRAPDPEDKLDAEPTLVGAVNGPEDAPFDWRQVDWRRVEDGVRRLRQRQRQRIFTASKAGDLKKVRSLQKLMLRAHRLPGRSLHDLRRAPIRRRGPATEPA